MRCVQLGVYTRCVVHAFVDKRREEDRDPERTQNGNHTVLVSTTPHENSEACRRQHK